VIVKLVMMEEEMPHVELAGWFTDDVARTLTKAALVIACILGIQTSQLQPSC
jgi:hypothetical protein